MCFPFGQVCSPCTSIKKHTSGQVWLGNLTELRGSAMESLDGVSLGRTAVMSIWLTALVVEFDLTGPSMFPGKKGFDRLVYASKNALAKPITWLFCNVSGTGMGFYVPNPPSIA